MSTHGLSVSTYLDVADDSIIWNQMRGRSGSGSGRRRRLDALRGRVDRYGADRATTTAPLWAHRLELMVVLERVPQVLLPNVLDDVLETLRKQRWQGEADPGVWAPLDRASFADTQRTLRRRERVAEATVLAALDGYASKPSDGRILECLRALEDLHEARVAMEPTFDLEMLVSEGKNLAKAVKDTLPVSARYVVSWCVEESFRSQLEGVPIDQLSPRGAFWFWHHHIAGLGVWHPIWQQVRSPYGPDDYGVWFVENEQAIYERWHAEAEARRAMEERQEEAKLAESEERQRHAAESDRIASDPRVRAEREERREREEQADRAAVQRWRKAQDRAREESETRRIAEEERQREEDRQAVEETERQELRRRRHERNKRDEQRRRRKDHQLRIPTVESAANRESVRRFLKGHGIRPVDLTPDIRAAFRRQFCPDRTRTDRN